MNKEFEMKLSDIWELKTLFKSFKLYNPIKLTKFLTTHFETETLIFEAYQIR